MASALPLLALGGAAVLLLGGKKKRRSSSPSFSFEDEMVVGGLSPGTHDVEFSPDLDAFEIGPMWRIRVLDNWLNERRKVGLLATVEYDPGSLYNFFIKDPATFIGEVTGTGIVGGSFIYGSLWIAASVGIGIYFSGYAYWEASWAASGQLGGAGFSNYANATNSMNYLRTSASGAANLLKTRQGYQSQALTALRMVNAEFAPARAARMYGVAESITMISAGAAVSGAGIAAASLAELGVDEIFTPDVAASAVEAMAEFTLKHNVKVSGVDIPIALLPGGDEFPAVQEFNKFIMGYIIKFQQRTFED